MFGFGIYVNSMLQTAYCMGCFKNVNIPTLPHCKKLFMTTLGIDVI